ncbi:hypothetical protein HDV05_000568 [Chytridiales sp. JEL 0842]|nr:hypothetical protein HDV05_000568 [Chytridiales sp. JEL 0842]
MLSAATSNDSALPPTGQFIEAVKSSSSTLLSSSKSHLVLSLPALESFLHSLEPTHVRTLTPSDDFLGLPLKFDTLESEISVISTMSLLNFGSSYASELKDLDIQVGDTSKFGVMSIYISGGSLLQAKEMKQVSLSEISSTLNIPASVEVKHPTLPLTMTEGSKLKPYLLQIQSVLQQTGDILLQHGCASLGAFVLNVTRPVGGQPRTAAFVVEALAKAFPAFRDAGIVDGKDIYILHKAQLLVRDLYARFSKTNPDRFNFPDINTFPVLSADNLLPTFLISKGILQPSEDVKKMIEDGSDFGTKDGGLDWILRAGVVVAGEKMREVLQGMEGELKDLLRGDSLGLYVRAYAEEVEAKEEGLKRVLNKESVFF